MLVDDRNEATKQSHTFLVAARDGFLSGWGKATDCTSYAAWACRPEDGPDVLDWVRARGDMTHVRATTEAAIKRHARHNHVHIYEVGESHPSVC
jgi:hypothetical protein